MGTQENPLYLIPGTSKFSSVKWPVYSRLWKYLNFARSEITSEVNDSIIPEHSMGTMSYIALGVMLGSGSVKNSLLALRQV